MPTCPAGFSLQPVPLELGEDEAACFASWGSNLYVGTAGGSILHLHRFDDALEYILIMRADLAAAVSELVVLADVSVLVALAGGTIAAFSLPELAPMDVGTVANIESMLRLALLRGNKQDKVVLFANSKISVAHVRDKIKILRDIPYAEAVRGVSAAAGTLSNYSNICIVANRLHYDVVDLQQTRRIPLFEYKNGQDVLPYIVPFVAEDKREEEYMLTVASDEKTSMAMFINNLGDVTRGTLTWLDEGYPAGLAVHWPYAVGLFKKSLTTLVFSSLESLTSDVRGLVEDDMKLATVEGVDVCDDYIFQQTQRVNVVTGEAVVAATWVESASILMHNGRKVFALQKEPPIKALLEKLETESLSDLVTAFRKEKSPLGRKILSVLLFLLDKTSELENADTTTLLFYLNIPNEKFWGSFSIERALLNLKSRFECSDSTARWLVQRAYRKDNHYLRSLPYSRLDQEQLLAVVDGESDLWKNGSLENEEIKSTLRKQEKGAILLRIALETENHEEIVLIARSLLEEPNMTVGDWNVDLVDVVLTHSQSLGSEIHTRHLLDLIKLFPKESIALLKARKNSIRLSTHKHILLQLSNADDLEWRLEFMEHSFSEHPHDTYLLNELLKELTNVTEVDDYKDSGTDLSWIDYMEAKDAHTLRKVYELLVIAGLDNETPPQSGFLNVFDEKDPDKMIEKLLSHSDVNSAEWVALYGKMPLPRPIFLTKSPEYQLRAPSQIKLSASLLIKTSIGDHDLVRRFLNKFAEYLDCKDVLALLPQNFPVVYLQDFVSRALMLLENRSRITNIAKRLARVDVQSSKKVAAAMKNALK